MLYAPRGIAAYTGAPNSPGAESTTTAHPSRSDDEIRAAVVAALDRADACEGELYALLPEPGRRERVLATLDTLLARYPDPVSRPPLFGVPVGVKDIFRADGFQTRAGSKLPPELFTGVESAAVTRLREAGAIVPGKTVTTEFAFAHPGPTRNPWKTDHTPGGSSSGSAAGVAAGYCPFALGTQTIGSINRPASFCGIVGFKPTYGRVPTDGVIPFSESADHVGLLAADVASARAGAAVMWDGWRRANASGRTMRFLVLEDEYSEQADEEVRAGVADAVRLLEDAGHEVRVTGLFGATTAGDDGAARGVAPRVGELNERHNRMIAREFADVHAGLVRDHRDRYAPRSLELIEAGRGVPDDELERSRAGRVDLRELVGRLLATERAVALITPSSMTAAPHGLDSTGSPLLNLPWTYAGVPTATLPASLTPGRLPVGVQLVGAFNSDEELIGTAALVERALRFAERLP